MGSNDWWKPEEGSQDTPAALPALSADRLKAILTEHDWKFATDNDGDIISNWDDVPFWFVLAGEDKEILQIICRCTRDFDPDAVPELQRAVMDWNRNQIWPKAYYRPHPETGQLSVFGEHTIDHEMGATDEQLELHLRCAVATGIELCKHISDLS